MRKKIFFIIILTICCLIIYGCKTENKTIQQPEKTNPKGTEVLTDEPPRVETTLTQEEVQQYCKNNFKNKVEIIKKINSNSFLVKTLTKPHIEFEVYSYQYESKDKKIESHFSEEVLKKAYSDLSKPMTIEISSNSYLVTIKLQSKEDIEISGEMIFSLVDSVKKIVGDDIDKMKYVVIFSEINGTKNIELGRYTNEELQKMDSQQLKTLVKGKFENRECVVEYDESSLDINAEDIFNKIQLYNSSNISFKIIAKPEFAESNSEYAAIFKNGDSIASVENVKALLKEKYDLWSLNNNK